MAWWRFSLQCSADDLEQVEALLQDAGAESISLADAGDEPLYEPLPGDSPVWQESVVSAIFDDRADPDALQQTLLTTLPARLHHSLRRDLLEEQDWELAYRDHFRPIKCADGLWIVPTWCTPPEPQAVSIRLDPGMAFGTGSHPTTALCLAWLAQHSITDCAVIDFGCGSGILAIAACKLGARRVVAVDIDPQALASCRANLDINEIDPARVQICAPDALESTPVDLLLANILAGPLIELAPRFAALLRRGGRILLSGILKTQLKEIQSAYRPYFGLDPANYREDWVSIGGTRK